MNDKKMNLDEFVKKFGKQIDKMNEGFLSREQFEELMKKRKEENDARKADMEPEGSGNVREGHDE